MFPVKHLCQQPLTEVTTVSVLFVFVVLGYWRRGETTSLPSGVCCGLKKGWGPMTLFRHWLATGRASGHNNSVPISPRGITYIPSVPIPSLPSLPFWEGHSGMAITEVTYRWNWSIVGARKTFGKSYSSAYIKCGVVALWLGSATNMSQVRVQGRSASRTTVGRLFTHMCLCSPSSINWYQCKLGAKQALHATH